VVGVDWDEGVKGGWALCVVVVVGGGGVPQGGGLQCSEEGGARDSRQAP
jgi:hypothetical protein